MSVNPGNEANSKDYRILIVDDEKPVLEVMTEILQSAGWTVDSAPRRLPTGVRTASMM